MGALDDIAGGLAAWAVEQGLIEKAEQHCDRWFANEGGTIDGWAGTELRKEFRSHCLCFESALLPYAYVVTRLDLYAPADWQVGHYRLITALSGEAQDDYLVIEQDKQEYLRRVSEQPAD